MKINIKFIKIDPVESIKEHIQTKLAPVEKFIKMASDRAEAQLHIEVARTTKHHHKGDVYKVAAILSYPKKNIRAEIVGSDVPLGIDELKHKIKQILEKEKDKKTTAVRSRSSSKSK